MENKHETFTYTYSAKEQEEVKSIRQKYIPREENKLEQLRRLDESVTRPGTIFSILLGTISTLILGVGMCCALVWTNLFVLGIIIGMIGIAGVALAYPVFNTITRKQREKLAPQIMKLSAELIQEK